MVISEISEKNPCSPTPCGPNSVCKIVNDQALCTCLPENKGSPPNCRPICLSSSECPLNEACIKQKCVNPCVEICGSNAQCRVHRHSPICTCLPGFEGDPFILCTEQKHLAPVTNPCEPNPCGPFSVCKNVAESATCSCKLGYVGVPPLCSPECTINEDCPKDKTCNKEKCVNPCLGSCGFNANCRASNHLAICTCLVGYRGDPFVGCYEVQKGKKNMFDNLSL